ncbi:hypothetical protein C8A05DRAFT_44997 [Staphylotrichum tortipilum]|uniref:Capsule synthesis protein CapA domain-containing protein n=1 Tax=Staphylotrichum tortipilum TaxID=2831512 RepID=A0AAN6MIS9_9PEZI|nr:hypothetical protein C8A05DRAFT_44997 [Staphylotrichum longicolle]
MPGSGDVRRGTASRASASALSILLALSSHVFGTAWAKTWTLTAGGDAVTQMVASSDPATQAVWDISRNSTFSFFNMEGQLLDLNSFTGYPMSENGPGSEGYGGPVGGFAFDPAMGKLLAGAGFNIASQANNHAWNFGIAGVEATQNALRAANISFAGAGHNLTEARGAGFAERNGLRLGLVASTGTHQPESLAMDAAPAKNYKARPGINVVRAPHVTVLDEADFAVIRKVAHLQGQTVAANATDITLQVGQTFFEWGRFRQAKPGTEAPRIDWDLNTSDRTGIQDAVKQALAAADTAIFSIHSHEPAAVLDNAESIVPFPAAASVPASYIGEISRAAIDAGADAAVVTGPRAPRGIEMYRGRPIFYGLGSLVFGWGIGSANYTPPVEQDDSFLARVAYADGRVTEVALYPLVHTQLTKAPVPEDAMPKMAPTAQAQRILGILQRLSRPLGTNIVIRGDVGYVDLGAV